MAFRSDDDIRRDLVARLKVRSALQRGGPLQGLGATQGGHEAWTLTCDSRIAEVLCELVTGLDGVVWMVIERPWLRSLDEA